MKVGLIARSEDRGLGVMTHAFYRHMHPAKTLLIAPTPTIAGGFAQHPDRFPDATIMPWDGGHLDERRVRDWLAGLDVAYTAETWYDPRIPTWAASMGVATVQHVMPEFFNADLPAPTQVWLPTTWRADQFNDPIVVPVPVEPVPVDVSSGGGPLRVLHVAGHRAMADRNGTITLLQALRLVKAHVRVTLLCQDRRMPHLKGVGQRVQLRRELGNQESLARWYTESDVLVLPRRYGGLCLPAQEALAHARALIMPDVEPNRDWPILAIPAAHLDGKHIKTAAGEIPMATVNPIDVARAIDALADDSTGLLIDAQVEARQWALDHSWRRLAPVYEQRLADAAAAL